MTKCTFEKALRVGLEDYLISELGITKRKANNAVDIVGDLIGMGEELPLCKLADDMEWVAPRIKRLIEVCMSREQ